MKKIWKTIKNYIYVCAILLMFVTGCSSPAAVSTATSAVADMAVSEATADSDINVEVATDDDSDEASEAIAEESSKDASRGAPEDAPDKSRGEKPEGAPEGGPDMPAGGKPGGGPGEPPEGGSGQGGPGGGGPGGGGPGGGDVDTGTGAYVLADGEELTAGVYTSTNADENAVRAEGDVTASLVGITVEKTGGDASNNDASSFYGLNAAILALDHATLNITGGTVTATAKGANGVFAYDGATINIEDTVIDVSGGNAGGIEVAGGGTLYATNLTVNATVKAAIRSDRGGGILVVDGGTYTTSGSSGAPVVYSTADITVNNATLVANDSEAVVVEGFNSVTLNDCDVTGSHGGTYGESEDNIHNVMLYQSMSGDAKVGTSIFTMTGGSLVSKNGDMFYITNTSSIINLSDVDLTLADGTLLLLVSGNSSSRGWGKEGANGGNAVFNLSEQTLSGDIMVDAISTLEMNMVDSSSFTGSINADGSEASALSVTIDASSTWTLTADSYITEFNGSMGQVVTNGYSLYVNGSAVN